MSIEKISGYLKKADNAEKIIDILSSKNFTRFYEGDYDDYIGGQSNAKSKEDIIKEIKRIFGSISSAEKIIDILSNKNFTRFYEGDYDDYIGGQSNAKSKEDIIKEIKRIFS